MKAVEEKTRTTGLVFNKAFPQQRAALARLRSDALVQLANDGQPYRLNFSVITRGKFCGEACIDESQAGDDSFFLCPAKNTFGIADGVGGWRSKGVDPGEISRALMNNARQFVDESTKGFVFPAEIIQKAHDKVKKDGVVKSGSTTACVIALRQPSLSASSSPASKDSGGGVTSCAVASGSIRLCCASVGDSGLAVLRNGKVILWSEFQRTGNCPEQLGIDDHYTDPCQAFVTERLVREGDVLVLATDGLWDNVRPLDPQEAKKQEAERLKVMDFLNSPAAAAAMERGVRLDRLLDHTDLVQPESLEELVGLATDPQYICEKLLGHAVQAELKPDDITVLVARIERVSQQTSAAAGLNRAHSLPVTMNAPPPLPITVLPRSEPAVTTPLLFGLPLPSPPSPAVGHTPVAAPGLATAKSQTTASTPLKPASPSLSRAATAPPSNSPKSAASSGADALAALRATAAARAARAAATTNTNSSSVPTVSNPPSPASRPVTPSTVSRTSSLLGPTAVRKTIHTLHDVDLRARSPPTSGMSPSMRPSKAHDADDDKDELERALLLQLALKYVQQDLVDRKRKRDPNHQSVNPREPTLHSALARTAEQIVIEAEDEADGASSGDDEEGEREEIEEGAGDEHEELYPELPTPTTSPTAAGDTITALQGPD